MNHIIRFKFVKSPELLRLAGAHAKLQILRLHCETGQTIHARRGQCFFVDCDRRIGYLAANQHPLSSQTCELCVIHIQRRDCIVFCASNVKLYGQPGCGESLRLGAEVAGILFICCGEQQTPQP